MLLDHGRPQHACYSSDVDATQNHNNGFYNIYDRFYVRPTVFTLILILNFDFMNWTSKTEVFRVPRKIKQLIYWRSELKTSQKDYQLQLIQILYLFFLRTLFIKFFLLHSVYLKVWCKALLFHATPVNQIVSFIYVVKVLFVTILLWQFLNSVAQIMCIELLFLNKIIQYFWFGKNNAYPTTRLAQLFCQKMMYLGVRQVFLGRVVLKLLQVYVPRACVQLWEAEIPIQVL